MKRHARPQVPAERAGIPHARSAGGDELKIVMLPSSKRAVQRGEAARAAAFATAREPLLVTDFCHGCGLHASGAGCARAAAVRRAITRLGQVPPHAIRPGDRFAVELAALPFWDSLDVVGVALALEEELAVELSDAQLQRVRHPEHHPSLSVRDFVADVLAVLTRAEPDQP